MEKKGDLLQKGLGGPMETVRNISMSGLIFLNLRKCLNIQMVFEKFRSLLKRGM